VGLDQVARVEVRRGPELINREQGQRRMVVMSNVRGRDLGSFVAEVRSRIDREMNLPPGYFIEYGGQFENQQRATRRLMLIVPVVLGLIFVLLFLTFNSFRLALLVVGNIPLALVGGITALWMRGMNLNLSASVDGINRSVLDSGLERARPVITRPARSYLAGSGQASAHCARVAPKKVLGPQSSFLCLRTIQA
jgi:Cu/Ag efflux pump CusA